MAWRPVTGAEDYEVSSAGEVRSGRGQLHARPDSDGYPVVDIAAGGARVTIPVHQLVLNAFSGPRPEEAVARHLDGDKANASAANLSWGTRGQNEGDKVFHGKRSAPTGDDAASPGVNQRFTDKPPSRVLGAHTPNPTLLDLLRS